MRQQTFHKSIKVGLVVSGTVLTGFLLAGCAKSTSTANTITTPPTPIEQAASTAPQTPQTNTNTMNYPASPAPATVVKAQTTDQAVTNEGSEMKQLDKESTTVDQSFNDQQINVN
jgi:hypothetical protein